MIGGVLTEKRDAMEARIVARNTSVHFAHGLRRLAVNNNDIVVVQFQQSCAAPMPLSPAPKNADFKARLAHFQPTYSTGRPPERYRTRYTDRLYQEDRK